VVSESVSDISAAAGALIKMIHDPSWRQEQAQKGWPKVWLRYNTERSVNQIDGVIQKYLPLQAENYNA